MTGLDQADQEASTQPTGPVRTSRVTSVEASTDSVQLRLCQSDSHRPSTTSEVQVPVQACWPSAEPTVVEGSGST